MFLKGFVTSLAVSFILIGAALAQDLKPMPPTHTDPVPSESPVVPAPSEAASAPEQKLVSNGLGKSYWLMANGSPVGYKIDVKINGNMVGSIRGSEQALDVSSHLRPGVNTATLVQTDTGSQGGGQLSVTLGPELSRQAQGPNQTYINLKENLVHFVRPADHRGGGGEATLLFPVGEEPNPDLTQRYIFYSQGEISGHKISVSLNGSPLVDIASPGAYFDLNPFLKPGENRFTFRAESLPGFSFSQAERLTLTGRDFEVGVAVVGAFDPTAYANPVRQLNQVVLRYTQPADEDQAVTEEELVLLAE